MTITIKRSFINVLLVFLSFLASSWFYKTYLISYAYYISNYGTDFAVALNVIITLILTYFTFVLLHLFYTRKITSKTIILSYFIYIFSLVYLILLKNIGMQGYSLNPLSFLTDIMNGSRFVPIMNVLMFIPLGFLFPLTKENLLFSLFGLLMIETCQYVFHLGIFDLGDVTLNLLSIVIGNIFNQVFLREWFVTHLISEHK